MSWGKRPANRFYMTFRPSPHGRSIKTIALPGEPSERAAEQDRQYRLALRQAKDLARELSTRIKAHEKQSLAVSHQLLTEYGYHQTGPYWYYKHNRWLNPAPYQTPNDDTPAQQACRDLNAESLAIRELTLTSLEEGPMKQLLVEEAEELRKLLAAPSNELIQLSADFVLTTWMYEKTKTLLCLAAREAAQGVKVISRCENLVHRAAMMQMRAIMRLARAKTYTAHVEKKPMEFTVIRKDDI